ncbi:cytochrome c biogenesis protein CcdA [Kitasatospora sp. YST-16]|uniref:cytochrome c biogenesis CcdA family protein n=1 Tax=Kitasatospora sp. YST-16 TaxID=2998080 RepID=UPI00228402CD|nr:cytochrome c biogenesis protein CcdA [Kitasatospora sp. YST-16]WAL72367.1 cytochrome c biogenesis protein CcdA [Kitasatospora sp. YST-16]WNW38415.1 cytochrome c biogenesis protein CcdA [Streptomyces sp. Li-HN-5-13]
MSALLAAADVGYNETVGSGALVLALPIALAAGLVSFFSPCVLPLVPGYLSYVTGFSAADLSDARGTRRGRMLLGSALFVAGFAAVFISEGALFGYVGKSLADHKRIVSVVMGVVTVLMGLAFMGLLPGFSTRELRTHRRPAVGVYGAPLLGLVFGVGWTPCLGPTMAAINTLSTNEADAGRGALLMTVYCLGLGVPFVLAALAFRKALGAFGWVKQHYQWVMRIGGGMLVAVGLALVTGVWDALVNQLQYLAQNFSIGI